MEMFLTYSWPGNIRELENTIKRFIILGNEAQLIAEFMRKRQDEDNALVSGREEKVVFGNPQPVVPMVPVQQKGNGGEESAYPDKSTLKEVAKIAQRQAERELIGKVLEQTRWNRRKAAQILDISYKALLYKIKECGLNQD
ncbi:MAG: hypothetical protein HKM86_09250, partial [Deltaproteobacteria bacterium]|nr:hypothetical protein [Deltaproteobacteria bacterium]